MSGHTRMPTVRTARAIAKQGELQGCIVIGFDGLGQIGGASYGATVAQCRQLGRFLDHIIDEVGAGGGPSLSTLSPLAPPPLRYAGGRVMAAQVQDDDPRISAILAKPYGRIVYPEGDGSFFAAILEFPGCMAAHTTAAKALSSLEHVARAWLAAELERGSPIPEPIDLTDVQRRLGLFPRYTREAG